MRLPSGGCCMYLLWFVVTSWLAFLHSFCWLAPYTDEILDVDTSKIASFICPTECTTRLLQKIVKTYITIYIKMILHVSVYQTIIRELIILLC